MNTRDGYEMNTRDGYEITIGETYCNFSGETLVVKGFFPDSEETGKVVVTPQFYIESMTANGDGGSYSEIHVDMDYEAEDSIVDASSIFKNAPTAQIDDTIKAKKGELGGLCQRIGLAKVELRLAREESEESINTMKAATDEATLILSEVRAKLKSSLDATE